MSVTRNNRIVLMRLVIEEHGTAAALRYFDELIEDYETMRHLATKVVQRVRGGHITDAVGRLENHLYGKDS